MDVMRKTTIYLPDELKEDLAQASERVGRSEAELIREAVGDLLSRISEPKPRLPLFSSGDHTLSERVDEELAGFGESGLLEAESRQLGYGRS